MKSSYVRLMMSAEMLSLKLMLSSSMLMSWAPSGAMLSMTSCCMSVFEMQMKLSWMMNKMMLMSDPMLLM